MGTKILAINPASVTSHQNYCDKKGFGFPILSDPEAATVAAYDCSKGSGKGVQRTVYAVNPKGRVIFAERGMARLDDVRAAIEEARE